MFQHTAARRRLVWPVSFHTSRAGFQHTAARRRLGLVHFSGCTKYLVSTHSRPKAAGYEYFHLGRILFSFNTQPPEGGWSAFLDPFDSPDVSTHSRPKAAGLACEAVLCLSSAVSTHSRPKAAGKYGSSVIMSRHGFNTQPPEGGWRCGMLTVWARWSFNTQPPEGGWASFV